VRKYEIYLPLNYNDGKSIESTKIAAICDDLASTFGAITTSPLSAPYKGRWKYGGVEYVDEIMRIEILTSDDEATEKFFIDFKERLKTSLRQIDILITTHGIQVI
jgi:hypothetical protein